MESLLVIFLLMFLTSGIGPIFISLSSETELFSQMVRSVEVDASMQNWSGLRQDQRIRQTLSVLAKNSTFFHEILKHDFRYRKMTDSSPIYNWTFPCKIFNGSPTVPTSVHKLMPGDIRVVGAIGDSLTAGNGAYAMNIIEVLEQYRGLAFTIGGDYGALTLPNILRRYNSKLVGYATGIGGSDSKNAGFDAAVPGAKSTGLMDQARDLVMRMISDPSISFAEDWKVITIFIGSNDLCDSCKDPTEYTTHGYIQRIKEVLDFFQESVPRAFVNILSPVQVFRCHSLNVGLICSLIHIYECICGAYLENVTNVRSLTNAYQLAIYSLVSSGIYDQKDDFTVVYQPFFMQTKIPRYNNGEVDLSYFAPDCFHFSYKGHAAAATALWNNMFQRVGNKDTQWVQGEDFTCPSPDHPYLYTSKNSNL